MFVIPTIAGLTFFSKNLTTKKSGPRIIYGYLTIGILIATIPFFIYFLNFMPWQEAILSITGYNIRWNEISGIFFYDFMAGYSQLSLNLQFLGTMLLCYAIIYCSLRAFCLGMDLSNRPEKTALSRSLIVLSAYSIIYIIHTIQRDYAYDVFRGQAVFIIILVILSTIATIRQRSVDNIKNSLIITVFCGWALLMLVKVPLRMKLNYYSLIYGLPGVLASIAFIVHVLPKHFENQFKSGRLVRIFSIIFLTIICSTISLQSMKWIALKNKKLSHGTNTIWTFDKPFFRSMGSEVDHFLNWAKNNMRPNETFIAFPEGVMLNFLTGQLITGNHPTFMPVEMMTYGEVDMLRSLKMTPPDYVILVNRSMLPYGDLIPGINYGNIIMDWFHKNYFTVLDIGQDFGSLLFGIKVLKRSVVP